MAKITRYSVNIFSLLCMFSIYISAQCYQPIACNGYDVDDGTGHVTTMGSCNSSGIEAPPVPVSILNGHEVTTASACEAQSQAARDMADNGVYKGTGSCGRLIEYSFIWTKVGAAYFTPCTYQQFNGNTYVPVPGTQQNQNWRRVKVGPGTYKEPCGEADINELAPGGVCNI